MQALGGDVLDVAPPSDGGMVVRVLPEGHREALLVEDLERAVLPPLELVADDRHLGNAVSVAEE